MLDVMVCTRAQAGLSISLSTETEDGLTQLNRGCMYDTWSFAGNAANQALSSLASSASGDSSGKTSLNTVGSLIEVYTASREFLAAYDRHATA